MHAPLRAGSDNAFLGGVINYILSNELDFREYVLAYTNASFLVDERYQDTEDRDGLFSGYNPPTTSYDPSSWHYQGTTPMNSTGTGDHAHAKEFSTPYQHGSGLRRAGPAPSRSPWASCPEAKHAAREHAVPVPTARLLPEPNTAHEDFAAITPLRCHVFRKASRSALIVSAWVVGMPCGKPS
jgi:anaerobic selenocysteine-containing dehydrogenase